PATPRAGAAPRGGEPNRPPHTGGAAAAPLFAQVAPGQLAHHGIFLRREEIHVARASSPAPQPPPVSSAAPARAARAPAVASKAPRAEPRPEPPTVQLPAFRDRGLSAD